MFPLFVPACVARYVYKCSQLLPYEVAENEYHERKHQTRRNDHEPRPATQDCSKTRQLEDTEHSHDSRPPDKNSQSSCESQRCVDARSDLSQHLDEDHEERRYRRVLNGREMC